MNKKYRAIQKTVIKMIIQQGIDNISMDEIAQNAAVSKVTIYKYYKDKEHMYLMVGSYLLETCLVTLESTVESAEDVKEKMAFVMDIYCKFIHDEHLWACYEIAKYYNDFLDDIEAFDTRRKSVLMHIIEEGIEAGIIRNDVSPLYLLHYIDMGLTYFQYNEAYRNQMTMDHEFRDNFMTFILSNILTEAGRA